MPWGYIKNQNKYTFKGKKINLSDFHFGLSLLQISGKGVLFLIFSTMKKEGERVILEKSSYF